MRRYTLSSMFAALPIVLLAAQAAAQHGACQEAIELADRTCAASGRLPEVCEPMAEVVAAACSGSSLQPSYNTPPPQPRPTAPPSQPSAGKPSAPTSRGSDQREVGQDTQGRIVECKSVVAGPLQNTYCVAGQSELAKCMKPSFVFSNACADRSVKFRFKCTSESGWSVRVVPAGGQSQKVCGEGDSIQYQ